VLQLLDDDRDPQVQQIEPGELQIDHGRRKTRPGLTRGENDEPLELPVLENPVGLREGRLGGVDAADPKLRHTPPHQGPDQLDAPREKIIGPGFRSHGGRDRVGGGDRPRIVAAGQQGVERGEIRLRSLGRWVGGGRTGRDESQTEDGSKKTQRLHGEGFHDGDSGRFVAQKSSSTCFSSAAGGAAGLRPSGFCGWAGFAGGWAGFAGGGAGPGGWAGFGASGRGRSSDISPASHRAATYLSIIPIRRMPSPSTSV